MRTVDKIFADKKELVTDFNFGRQTAEVFDDMLLRSVPFYAETQRMIVEIAEGFALDGTQVYDLGCSTGTTLALLDKVLPLNIKLVGVDNSPEMLAKAKGKLQEHNVLRPIDLRLNDLDEDIAIDNASVVIVNLTLQFVRPLIRERVVRRIADGMVPGSALILVEKVLTEDPLINRNFIKYYYDFKHGNGYTDMEITQKREALENVLIPYRTTENRVMLLRSGFSSCEIFFKWYNFCGYIARKAG